MRLLNYVISSTFLLSACMTTPDPQSNFKAVGDTVVEANTLLSSDLLSELSTLESSNIFVSSLSLSTAIGMLEAGAGGETKEQISRVFRYPQTNIHSELGALREAASRIVTPGPYDESDPQITSIANSVWTAKSVALKSQYIDILREDYGLAPEQLDFESAPDKSREIINDWVEAQTNDRIKDLLKKPNVRPETRLVLVNTIYMMSHWQEVFNENNTKLLEFYVNGEDAEPRDLMHQTGAYQRLKINGGEALKIPYANQTSMIVMRPKGKRGLESVNSMMTQNAIREVLENIDEAPSVRTDLALPKFKIEKRYELEEPLQNLGLTSIFSDDADFTNISSEKRLRVSNIIQQVFLDVNEKGTEAAAATAVTIVTTGARLNPPEPEPFVVDRPFIMLIRDDVTGAVMFAGRITDPS